MNWYLESGKDSDVIISSRIRLARNIKNLPFKLKMTKEDKKQLLEKVKFITPSIGYGLTFFYLKDIDDLSKMTLVEKHMISPEMAFVEKHIISPEMALTKEEEVAIVINEEENICIMINEEDHLRLQVFSSGRDLQNTLQLAIEIEQKLDEQLGFSCTKEYGYLKSRHTIFWRLIFCIL